MVIWIPCNPPTSWGKNSKTPRSSRNADGTNKNWLQVNPAITSTKEFLFGSLAEYVPEKPFEGPVRLTLSVKFPYNKGTSKKRMASDSAHTTKPDLDNILATVQDVMQTMRFFTADAQIADVAAKKWRSTDPGIVITLEALENGAN